SMANIARLCNILSLLLNIKSLFMKEKCMFFLEPSWLSMLDIGYLLQDTTGLINEVKDIYLIILGERTQIDLGVIGKLNGYEVLYIPPLFTIPFSKLNIKERLILGKRIWELLLLKEVINKSEIV